MRTACFVASLALLLSGCPEEDAALYVELRTDLVPGEEFVAVEVTLDEGAAREDRPVVATDDFSAGRRVADLDPVARGTHTLDVRLRDASGMEVASRRVRVQLNAELGLTVLITRGCARTRCEGADRTCVRAACASVECHEIENPDACTSAECEADADCPAPAASCAEARCVLGACVTEPVGGVCGPAEYCDPETGCRARGGVADAGVDGGSDAGPCAALPAPLGYWPLDAADVIGDQVRDRSGNGRHGTMMGTPLPVVASGRVGEALDFAGTTTAWIDLGALPVDGSPSGSNTVSMWYRRAGPDVDEAFVHFPATPSPAPPRYGLWLNTDRIGATTLCINTGGGECWGVADPDLLDRWVHVTAVVVNGATTGGALYVNGAAVSMSCVFGTCDAVRTVATPVTLSVSEATYDWHGQLDEVRIFDRALTEVEIAQLYACSQ